MRNITVIIVILFSFFATAYSQDTSTNTPVTARFEFKQPITSLFTRMEGLTVFYLPSSGKKTTTYFVHTSGISLSIGRKLFFYTEAASGYSLDGNDIAGMNMSGGIGLGYYLLDKRSIDNKGSSLKMSILYSFRYDSTSTGATAGLGGLALLNYDYSFFRNFALRLGLHFGAYGVSDPSISYGLSLGIAF